MWEPLLLFVIIVTPLYFINQLRNKKIARLLFIVIIYILLAGPVGLTLYYIYVKLSDVKQLQAAFIVAVYVLAFVFIIWSAVYGILKLKQNTEDERIWNQLFGGGEKESVQNRTNSLRNRSRPKPFKQQGILRQKFTAKEKKVQYPCEQVTLEVYRSHIEEYTPRKVGELVTSKAFIMHQSRRIEEENLHKLKREEEELELKVLKREIEESQTGSTRNPPKE